MTTAIDTNVIVALWDRDDSLNSVAQSALDSCLNRGALFASAPVFAELLALPGRSEVFVRSFFKETGIAIDWELGEAVWRTAGLAFQSYTARRRKHGESGPRRILADFLIGAHAFHGGHGLLTLDKGLYPSFFPRLRIETI